MSATQALVVSTNGAAASVDDFLPIMSLDQAIARRDDMVKFVKRIMTPDVDFGKIPGTKKDVLLKPGAEKLCVFFGLSPDFDCTASVEDWTGEQHNGEPFFYYKYHCRLSRNGRILGAGEGSCNSWEAKYRYRNAQRVCPKCQQAAIIADNFNVNGGWYCFPKKQGCGAKFAEDNPAIRDQPLGRIANPDIADVVNTLQKMAQKRALVAATLIATSASEFYTQDSLEDEPLEPQSRANGKASEHIEDVPAIPSEEFPAGTPDDLRALWSRMPDVASFLKICAEFKYAFSELTGSDIEYYAVLHQNGIKGDSAKKDMRTLNMDQCRKIVAAMQSKLTLLAKALKPPDEVPEEVTA